MKKINYNKFYMRHASLDEFSQIIDILSMKHFSVIYHLDIYSKNLH